MGEGRWWLVNDKRYKWSCLCLWIVAEPDAGGLHRLVVVRLGCDGAVSVRVVLLLLLMLTIKCSGRLYNTLPSPSCSQGELNIRGSIVLVLDFVSVVDFAR